MRRAKIHFTRIAIVVAVLTFFFLCGIIKRPIRTVSAEETKTFSTTTLIAQQGDKGLYYAWGTPENYVLMFYGALSGGGEGWRGVEIYSTVSGSSLHPGNYWGVMVVWVADESGTISLTGEMKKGTTQGDGVTLGVYHQHYGGELDTLFERFVDGRGELEYALDREIEVSKGDSFVFYCDSGKGKDNPSDSSDCPFTITYTERAQDNVEGEDLSVYLNAGRAGDVGGFKHIEQDFAAENLDGTLTKKTTVKGGCSSSVSPYILVPVSFVIPVMLTVCFALRRRKDK